jgi:hypothetical protein
MWRSHRRNYRQPPPFDVIAIFSMGLKMCNSRN